PTTVVIGPDSDPREAFDRIEQAKVPLAVAVDADGHLLGVLTRLGALRATLYSPAVDSSGRLRVAAAVGVNGEVAQKAAALLEAGEDGVLVDTADGHRERRL